MCNEKVIETNTNVGMSLLVNMIFMKIFNIILIKWATSAMGIEIKTHPWETNLIGYFLEVFEKYCRTYHT